MAGEPGAEEIGEALLVVVGLEGLDYYPPRSGLRTWYLMVLILEPFFEVSVSRILAVGLGAWSGCVVGKPFVEASVADVVFVAFTYFVPLFFEKFVEAVYVYVFVHVR